MYAIHLLRPNAAVVTTARGKHGVGIYTYRAVKQVANADARQLGYTPMKASVAYGQTFINGPLQGRDIAHSVHATAPAWLVRVCLALRPGRVVGTPAFMPKAMAML